MENDGVELFSLTNVPVPTHTPLRRPITKGFKYRVLGYNADTQLDNVAQLYAHRKTEVTAYMKDLQGKYTFVVSQIWDDEVSNYK